MKDGRVMETEEMEDTPWGTIVHRIRTATPFSYPYTYKLILSFVQTDHCGIPLKKQFEIPL